MSKFNFFISSVQQEFKHERLRLFDYIQSDALLSEYFTPIMFEKLPAASQSPNKVYIDEVKRSHVYLVILGSEYGYENVNGIAPTELEYECAKENHLYKIALIKGDNLIERHKKEKVFIKKIQGELT